MLEQKQAWLQNQITEGASCITGGAITHLSSSWSLKDKLSIKLSMLYNESLIYIVSTLCYNELIRAEHNLNKISSDLSSEWILIQEINRFVRDWLNCSTLQKHIEVEIEKCISRAQTIICN